MGVFNNKDKLKDKILFSYKNNRLPHSFTLFGNCSISDKADFIIELAYIILKPKRNCSFDEFKKIIYGENGYTDFIWIKPQDKGSILNFEIEKLDDILIYTPYESENRIVFISSAETMTDSAQNSLLKKLEEPPSNNFFFLSAPNKASLLPTIVSRTLPLYLKNENSYAEDAVLNNSISDSRLDPLAEKIIAESISSWFLSSKSGFKTFNEMYDKFGKNLSSDSTVRKIQLSYRFLLFALSVKEKYPSASLQIFNFLENEQYFSADSVIFYNLFNIFKEMKG